MALINLKEYKKANKLKNMSGTVMEVLKKYAGWGHKGLHSSIVNPAGTKGTNGIDFWNIKGKRSEWGNRDPSYLMPVNKAKVIILDTKLGLLIFDELVAVNVS